MISPHNDLCHLKHLNEKSSQYSQKNKLITPTTILDCISLLKEIRLKSAPGEIRLKSAPGTHLNERRRAGLTRLAVAPCFVVSSRRKICLTK